MRQIVWPALVTLTLAAALSGCSPAKKPVEAKPAPQAPQPPPPPLQPVEPGIEAEVVSLPEKAVVIYREREFGETPVNLHLTDLGDLSRVVARRDGKDYVEKRVRILSPERVQITFRFGEPTGSLKALGFAKAVVFDYSDRAVFDVDKADLKPEVLPVLELQAAFLVQHFGDVPVYVCGHTDNTGGKAHNLALSLDRAQAVAACLERHQVPKDRMRVQGYGPDYPLDSNDTPEGRALNRRTELVLPE
ncbi:MAG: OmpA family protein [Acidobacteria bacterium]|nr:OmpA family protein [Acidobacteriota bacterium]